MDSESHWKVVQAHSISVTLLLPGHSLSVCLSFQASGEEVERHMHNLEWRKGVAMEVDLQHFSVQLNTTPTLSSLVFPAIFFFLSFSDQFSKLFFFSFRAPRETQAFRVQMALRGNLALM